MDDELSAAMLDPRMRQLVIAQLAGGAAPGPNRPSLGPIPDMGNPVRPNPMSPSYNLNMRPTLPEAPRQPNGLAKMFLQTMSPEGLQIPGAPPAPGISDPEREAELARLRGFFGPQQ